MINVEIHVICPQIPEAGIDHVLDMLLPVDTSRNLVLSAGQEFGGDHHLIPLCKVTYSTSQVLLAGTALVAHSRVKKVYSQLQSTLYDLSGMLLIKGPAVLAVIGISKAHTAHAEPGYLKI